MRAKIRLEISVLIGVALVWSGIAASGAEEAIVPPEAVAVAEQEAPLIPETLTLARAIEIAIKCNPQVEASRQGIKLAQGQLTQAISYLLPRVNVSSRRVTPVDLPPFSFQSADSTWETELSLTQPLYTGGVLRKGVQAAKSYRRGSAGAFRRTRQEIAFAVRQSYYGVLTAQQAVAVAQEVIDSAQEHLRVARLRYEAGVAPQFDALAAEARVARVEQGLISARVYRDIAWAGLSTVLGVPIPEGTKLTRPESVAIEEADFRTLRQEALANRPDLLAGEAQRAAALAALEIARGARHPTVSAAVSYTLREKTTIAGDVFGVPGGDIVVSQNSGYLAVVANYSLFNAGQVEGEIRAAEAQLKQAEKAVEGLEQQIELDVKRAHLLVEAAEAQVAAAQKEVAQAQEAHRIATIRYQEGVGTSVEILDAEANLEGAKTRLNEAVFGLDLAIAQLDLALGRDWAESISSAPDPECARE